MGAHRARDRHSSNAPRNRDGALVRSRCARSLKALAAHGARGSCRGSGSSLTRSSPVAPLFKVVPSYRGLNSPSRGPDSPRHPRAPSLRAVRAASAPRSEHDVILQVQECARLVRSRGCIKEFERSGARAVFRPLSAHDHKRRDSSIALSSTFLSPEHACSVSRHTTPLHIGRTPQVLRCPLLACQSSRR
jgi:hypothetical protein